MSYPISVNGNKFASTTLTEEVWLTMTYVPSDYMRNDKGSILSLRSMPFTETSIYEYTATYRPRGFFDRLLGAKSFYDQTQGSLEGSNRVFIGWDGYKGSLRNYQNSSR